MARSKEPQIRTGITKSEFEFRLKHAIWTCRSWNFHWQDALRYINSGMLGYQLDKKGEPKKDNQNKPMPIIISRTKYFEALEKTEDMPQVYEDVAMFARKGFIQMMVGFQSELATLHKMSIQNLMAKDLTPVERQQIISDVVKNVLPARSAFMEAFHETIETDPLLKKALESEENAKH